MNSYLKTVKEVAIKIWVVILLLPSTIVLAQNQEVDSLENLLLHSAQDTNRVLLLNTIAYKLHTSNPDKGNRYARESIDLATHLSFDKGRAHAYNSLGAGYWNQAQYDSALKYYTRSYQLNDTLGNVRGVTGALSNMAIIFDTKGEYVKSVEYYTLALKEMEANGFDSYVAITSNNLGLVLQRLGRLPEALDYFNRAINIGEPLGMTNLVGPAWINISKVYRDMEDPETRLSAIETALKIGEESNSAYVMALALNNLGRYYQSQSDDHSALITFKKSLKINTAAGRKRSVSANLNNIGVAYRNLGVFDSSTYYIQKAQNLAKEINHNKALISTYHQMGLTLKAQYGCTESIISLKEGFDLAKGSGELIDIRDISLDLSKCHEAQGNFKQAHYFHKEYAMAKDSLLDKEKIKDLARVEANFEFESQLSEKDNEIILLETKEQVSQLRLFLGLGGAFVVLVIGFFIARSQLKAKALQNKHFKELGKFKEAMTGMVAHDLKNPLGIILSTESEKPSTREMAKQMLNLVNNMLDVHKFESTQVVLSPTSVSIDQIVTDAIEQVRPLLSQKNIVISTSTDSNYYINADREYLLRVFVNLFTNAIKYSPNNDKIEVEISKKDDAQVYVQVIDHGSGIAPENLRKIFEKFGQVDPQKSGSVGSTGLGLSFCQLAIRAHGSELEVESKLSEGTKFKFALQLIKQSETVASVSTDEFVFTISQDERDQILSKIPSLRSMKLHQAFAIEEILNGIQSKDEMVLSWSTRVLDAAYANNELHYNELLDLIENTN